MILGVGTDIIEVSRIKSSIDRHGHRFLDRIFTQQEQDYCLKYQLSERHFAGRFAAKEAAVKALGVGLSQGIGWHDIEVVNDSFGKPCIVCSEALVERFGNPRLLLSLSHCHEFATAVVIWES